MGSETTLRYIMDIQIDHGCIKKEKNVFHYCFQTNVL